MSFSQEMKEFIGAFQAGTKIYDEKSENDLRRLTGELYKERAESERHERGLKDAKLKLQQDQFAEKRRKALNTDSERDNFIGAYVASGGKNGVALPDVSTPEVSQPEQDDEDPGYAAGGAVEAGQGDSAGPGTPFSKPGPGPNDNRPHPGNVAQGMETSARLDQRYDSYTPKPLQLGPSTPGPDYDALKDKYTDQIRQATQNVRDRIRRHNQARRENNLANREERPSNVALPINQPYMEQPNPNSYMGANEGNYTGDGFGDRSMHFADGGAVDEPQDGLPTRDELREYVKMGLDAIEEDIRANPQLQDAYLTGEAPNAPTDQEIAGIDRLIGLDGEEGYAEGGVVGQQGKAAIADYEKAELRLGAMVSWYLQKGDYRKARDAAKNLLAYHQAQTSRYSALAMTALQNGDREAAAKYANKAAGNVLNGQLQVIRPLPDGSFEYQSIDPHTKKVVERARATPQQVGGVLQNSLAGGIPLQSLMQFVGQKPMKTAPQPRLSEKERAVATADDKVATIKKGMRAIDADAQDDMFDTSGVRTRSTAIPAGGGRMSEVQDTREQNDRIQRKGALEIGDIRYTGQKHHDQGKDWDTRRAGYDAALDTVWNEGTPDKSGKVGSKPPAPELAQRQWMRQGINALLQRNEDLDPQDAARFVSAIGVGVEPKQHEDGSWQVGNVRAFVPGRLLEEARLASKEMGAKVRVREDEKAGAAREEANKPSWASGFNDVKDVATAPVGAALQLGKEAGSLIYEKATGQSRPERENNDPEGWVGWGQ